MNEALATLSKSEGVIGVAVVQDPGTCLVNDLPPPYEPVLVGDIVRRLAVAFDPFSSMDDGTISSFSMDCDEGSLILRRVEDLWVLALTQSKINVSMLNVAMNVVALNLSRGRPGALPERPAPSSEALSSRFNLSQSVSRPGGEIEIPPDAVDRVVVQQLLQIYADYMGPAAKAVLKRQLEALGVTSRTLRRAQFGDLVARLTATIPSAARQQEFASAVRQYQDRLRL